ncbi:MAG: hypothetical protein KDN22_10800 [Verrucomicrobiae bacterium]|nr:hypothetical protein [Verrucomicrobiae bacterium]
MSIRRTFNPNDLEIVKSGVVLRLRNSGSGSGKLAEKVSIYHKRIGN